MLTPVPLRTPAAGLDTDIDTGVDVDEEAVGTAVYMVFHLSRSTAFKQVVLEIGPAC